MAQVGATSTHVHAARDPHVLEGARSAVPASVRWAGWLWVAAVAAGVVEVAMMLGSEVAANGFSLGILAGLGMRALIYAAVIGVVVQLWRGRPWARLLLAVGLGGFGTLSLVIDPLSWLVQGGTAAEAFAMADSYFVLQAAVRAAHIAAVFAALFGMFLPSANTYFRR